MSSNSNYLTREEYERRKILDIQEAWYNPSKKREKIDGVMVEPETIYLGEKSDHQPTWEYPVFDVARHREHLSLIRQGKINDDRLQYGAYKGEWEDIANEFAERKEMGDRAYNQFRSANVGIITSSDSPALNVVQILGEILGRDTKTYNLENAVTKVSTPNLSISVDAIHGFTASADVGEGVEPDVKKGKFTRTAYTLKKDAGYIMQTDEASFTNDRDTFNLSIQQVTRDLVRILNQKIATKLESADVADAGGGSDWLAYTGEHRAADPLEQIGTAMDIIRDNGGNPDTIASDPKPLREFNTNVQGGQALQNAPSPLTSTGFTGVYQGVGGLPLTWYVDSLLAANRVTIYDKSAVMLMQGPVRTAQFRDERRGLDAYITRNWNAIHIIDTSVIRYLAPVTT
jgi:hypothetical protein